MKRVKQFLCFTFLLLLSQSMFAQVSCSYRLIKMEKGVSADGKQLLYYNLYVCTCCSFDTKNSATMTSHLSAHSTSGNQGSSGQGQGRTNQGGGSNDAERQREINKQRTQRAAQAGLDAIIQLNKQIGSSSSRSGPSPSKYDLDKTKTVTKKNHEKAKAQKLLDAEKNKKWLDYMFDNAPHSGNLEENMGVAVEGETSAILNDQDGDLVSDDLDNCPNTGDNTDVDQNGCPVDMDGDGVMNTRDLCPRTPANEIIDKKTGCTCAQLKDKIVIKEKIRVQRQKMLKFYANQVISSGADATKFYEESYKQFQMGIADLTTEALKEFLMSLNVIRNNKELWNEKDLGQVYKLPQKTNVGELGGSVEFMLSKDGRNNMGHMVELAELLINDLSKWTDKGYDGYIFRALKDSAKPADFKEIHDASASSITLMDKLYVVAMDDEVRRFIEFTGDQLVSKMIKDLPKMVKGANGFMYGMGYTAGKIAINVGYEIGKGALSGKDHALMISQMDEYKKDVDDLNQEIKLLKNSSKKMCN